MSEIIKPFSRKEAGLMSVVNLGLQIQVFMQAKKSRNGLKMKNKKKMP